jgi:hypothetical protein
MARPNPSGDGWRHLRGEGLGDHALLSDQLLQAALGEFGLDAEQLGSLGDQLRLGQIAVAVLGCL